MSPQEEFETTVLLSLLLFVLFFFLLYFAYRDAQTGTRACRVILFSVSVLAPIKTASKQ